VSIEKKKYASDNLHILFPSSLSLNSPRRKEENKKGKEKETEKEKEKKEKIGNRK
jgi:hypothetical protein